MEILLNKKTLKIVVFILMLTQSSFAQKYEVNLVSKKTELNFVETKMRGIKCGKIIYFVAKDLETVTAYENGKIKWKTNVISICGKPKVGKPKIRYLKLKAEKLLIAFGKHSYAEIDKETGKTNLLGSD